MGVKDLNVLFQKCTPESNNKTYSKIVIDGSNLIFQKLSSSVSQLKKEYPISDWQSINLDLLEQTNRIVRSTIDSIRYTIRSLIRNHNPGHIYIVMDPVHITPNYVISAKLKNVVGGNELANARFIHDILTDEEIENNIQLTFTVKEEEQEQRKNASSKTGRIADEFDNLDDLNLDQLSIDVIKDVFNQSYHYSIISNMLALSRIVLNEIAYSLSDRVTIVDSNNEADLVIKNVVHIFNDTDTTDGSGNENHRSLVMSEDTDYYILFADDRLTDVSKLKSGSPIYNPYKCWKYLLGESYSFDAVIRLAPLFGNDYTAHKAMMSPKTKDALVNIKALFDPELFDEIKGNKRTTLYKIVKNYSPDENFGIEMIDELIRNYDPKYFIKYYKSIIVYKNWDIYNDFDLYEPEYRNLKNEIVNHCQRLQAIYRKLIRWNGDMLFVNWGGLVESVEVIDFGESEGCDGPLNGGDAELTNEEGDEFIGSNDDCNTDDGL